MSDLTTIDPKIASKEYIFNRVFLIRTTEEALRDGSNYAEYGTSSTGYKQHDSKLINLSTQCYLTIAKMANLADKGYPVSLANRSDAKTIYEFVQYHLDSWMKAISGGLNLVKAPYDDLKILDRFATSIYGVAVHQYEAGVQATAFGRFMDQFHHLSEDAFSIKPPEPKETEIKQRPSLQEALLEHQAKMFG